MNKERQIKAYYERMDKLAIKIEDLANKNQPYHIEQNKWKSMYENVRRLIKEKECEEKKK